MGGLGQSGMCLLKGRTISWRDLTPTVHRRDPRRSTSAFYAVECVICKGKFEAPSPSSRQCCSDKCRDQYRRQRQARPPAIRAVKHVPPNRVCKNPACNRPFMDLRIGIACCSMTCTEAMRAKAKR